ncbi:MAG TPA: nuclear transport factor 2 family protein [Bacteroidia bacterium]|mgnify:CR=1 FL=1|nr:nuclear transport factor 2 family protein [Bacteroidia bacterium]
MKLTKKLEAEILETYNKAIDANLKGDIKTFASMLDENCHVVGTAASEVFNNKKSAVTFYKATAGQITGKVEFRNRKASVMIIDNEVMVNEILDFYVLVDDQWTFYNTARISCLLNKKYNQWKVIHIHGSFPDSKAEEGEQINSEKIKAENIQLRDAIRRRTEELEIKNRDLEIEAALERVRARAMAMHTSDELKDVAKELRKQIRLLGQEELNTCVIHLYDESEEYVQSWGSQQSENNDEITEFYGIVPKKGLLIIEESLQSYWSGRKEYTLINEKNKLKQWISFLKKTYPVTYAMIVESYHGLKPDQVPMYWSHSDFSGGSLLMVTLAPPDDVSKILLRRFANVFGLAYRRFVDLKNAEAQAREAQIEAALERVRSRSLAMHKSSEVMDVAIVVYNELQKLNFKSDEN